MNIEELLSSNPKFVQPNFRLNESVMEHHPSAAVMHGLQKVLLQLSNEMIIFERLMYKNANQHRRALYFRRLRQVRGELRLLQSARLSQLLQSFEQCHQNTIQSRKDESVISKVTDLRRHIYGVVRLLDQMAESILSASLQVAGLLGQTFFMAFALTILAALARLRVLSQQALHDFICIFNLLSAGFKYKPEENGKIPNHLNCKWDDEGKLSFGTSSTHQHQEMVGNVSEQEGCAPCSSMPDLLEKVFIELNSAGLPEEQESAKGFSAPCSSMPDSVEKAAIELNSAVLTEERGDLKGLKLSIPEVDPCSSTPATIKKVAYISACKIPLPQTEKLEDTGQIAKKQKADALYDMLLGLHDTTKDTIF